MLTLRAEEFGRLDAQGVTYLDYAGAALYPDSLVRRHAARLGEVVLGNPHSEGGPSKASSEAIDRARRKTLAFLGASAADYDVVFTANASGALRILAEAFPFEARSALVLTADNHNSVNGLREPALAVGAAVRYVPLDDALRSLPPIEWLPAAVAPSLFAYPAQSNFSGVRHPLTWVDDAQTRGYRVVLDAAAYLSTARLDLARIPADFVALSFYKIFGYPTGVGALVARRDALALLRRRYFAGGTVEFVSVQHRLSRLRGGAEGFEDGTPDFLAMDAVCDGLDWFMSLGRERVGAHVHGLMRALVDGLASLGSSVEVYGPPTLESRGGVVTFNIRHGDEIVPYEQVEQAAARSGLAIRGGCFCNPGAAERAFDLNRADTRPCLDGPFSVPRLRQCVGGRPVGALRASVGVATTSNDVARLLDFVVAARHRRWAEAEPSAGVRVATSFTTVP